MIKSWQPDTVTPVDVIYLNQKKLTLCSLLLIILFSAVSLKPFAQTNNDFPVTFEGEFVNSIDNDFTDESLVTKAGFVTELEWEDNLSLDIGLTTEYQSDAEDTSEIELDLEVLPGAEKDLAFYLESDLSEYEYDETEFGIETTLWETDFELGIDLKETEKIFSLDFYRWFEEGFSLRGGLRLENGPEFKDSHIAFRGIPLSLNDEAWELSGELEGTLEESIIGETEHVKLSFSLENENTDYFRFPKQGKEVSFYRLNPRESGDYTIVLFNSGEKLNLEGWSIGSRGDFYEISKKRIIQSEQKLEVKVKGNIVDDKSQLQIRNPNGETEDTWSLPRFYFGNNELFRREGSLERQIEISFDDNEFDELTVDWDLEIPTGPDSYFYGVLELDHIGHLGKGEVGYRGPRSDLDISLLDEEIEINYYPRMKSAKYQSEIGLKLNNAGKFETVFEIEQDFEGLEVVSALEFSSEQEKNEIELGQEMEWEQLELELVYLFEDSDFAGFEIDTGFAF